MTDTVNNTTSYAQHEYEICHRMSKLLGNTDNLSDELQQQLSEEITKAANAASESYLAERISDNIRGFVSRDIGSQVANETLFAVKNWRYHADIAYRAGAPLLVLLTGLFIHSKVRKMGTTDAPSANPFQGTEFKATPRPAGRAARTAEASPQLH
jgi:hypothetical protein